jgi:hypothetical protein
MQTVLARLRNVPSAAYVFMAFSSVGVAAELAFHFIPPSTFPPYGQWLAGLSPVDREFFGLAFELTAHVGIALGLMGMLATLMYYQLRKSES